ncbi:MAG: cytochrome c [Mesorhizobium sp.]|nr:cytochrome c [Mesorhizobium sp.]
MRSLILSVSILAMAMSAASADPIADRKAAMKERGGLVGSLAPIAKGEQPFDSAKVAEVFAALKVNADAYNVDALFPAGSETGDTTASPKIWEDMAGFKAAVDKYKAEVTAADAAKPADLDAFRAEFGKVTANCGSCHEVFRVKKG